MRVSNPKVAMVVVAITITVVVEIRASPQAVRTMHNEDEEIVAVVATIIVEVAVDREDSLTSPSSSHKRDPVSNVDWSQITLS